MNQESHIEVVERATTGKNESRRLRASGYIPAVVYGGGREPVSVQVDPRPVEAIIDSPTGLNSLIHLKVGGQALKRMVMIRDVQRHPATEMIEHADFVRVDMDKTTQVSVPVELVGVASGVKDEGGLIDFINRSVVIEVLPANIPTHFAVNIEALMIGQHLEAKDIELPEGVTLISPPTATIVNCIGKAAEEEVEVVEGEETEEATEASEESDGESTSDEQ